MNLLILLGVLASVGYAIWITLDIMRRAPAREASADLPGVGLVSIRLSTDLYPALPTGVVQLIFEPKDSRDQLVELDELTFTFGQKGLDRPVGEGQAALVLDGSGRFEANVTFGSVGEWWLRAVLERGEQRAEFSYAIIVEPAQ